MTPEDEAEAAEWMGERKDALVNLLDAKVDWLLEKAYLAGVKAERERQAKEELNGWCAWHPKLSFYLSGVRELRLSAMEVVVYGLSQAWDELEAKGWRIVPVKLAMRVLPETEEK